MKSIGDDVRLNLVLVEPEIPPNTGNIARLCAATRTRLHLIEPLGFRLDDATLKRAGMDYWTRVDWHTWRDWDEFRAHVPAQSRLWYIESGGPRRYIDAEFSPGDYLVFGRETLGLPRSMVESDPDHWLRIPMMDPQSRSLNLSNCAAIVLYEALRQTGFMGLTGPGES